MERLLILDEKSVNLLLPFDCTVNVDVCAACGGELRWIGCVAICAVCHAIWHTCGD